MFKNLLLISSFVIFLGCSSNNSTVSNPITGEKKTPGLFSKDAKKGISLSDILNQEEKSEISVNVNGYLWRASLDVLSIAPLISTDALGGTIITDWYVNKKIKNKRIKIMAYIKTSELRSDGISVKVHVQNLESGVWTDTYTNEKLASKIENNILNEARNYRINSSNN
ncbi:DUF3576 domain-containing protein [Alphaproteobacteria bacterium]|nr:DUF3576 domain-containing protein [Alphaproteobacteria bacterium]